MKIPTRAAKRARFLATAGVGLLLLVFVGAPAVTPQQPAQQRPRRVTKTDSQAPAKPTPPNAQPVASPTTSPTSGSSEEVDEGDVVRVETQLVSVPAVVTTAAGRPVSGLRAENFLLFENGQQQEITN